MFALNRQYGNAPRLGTVWLVAAALLAVVAVTGCAPHDATVPDDSKTEVGPDPNTEPNKPGANTETTEPNTPATALPTDSENLLVETEDDTIEVDLIDSGAAKALLSAAGNYTITIDNRCPDAVSYTLRWGKGGSRTYSLSANRSRAHSLTAPTNVTVAFDWSFAAGPQERRYALAFGKRYQFAGLSNRTGIDLFVGGAPSTGNSGGSQGSSGSGQSSGSSGSSGNGRPLLWTTPNGNKYYRVSMAGYQWYNAYVDSNRTLWIEQTCFTRIDNSSVDSNQRVFLNGVQIGKIIAGRDSLGYECPWFVDNNGYIMRVKRCNGRITFYPTEHRPGLGNPYGPGSASGRDSISPCTGGDGEDCGS